MPADFLSRMLRWSAASMALLLVLSLPRSGAAKDEPEWTVTVDPLTVAVGYVHVQVERTLGDSFSVYAGPHLRLFNGVLSEPDDDFLGWGGEVGVRYFFGETAPSGFWAMVRGVGAYVTAEADGSASSALGGYASALGGYTWIPARHWVLSAGAGVQYVDYDIGGMGFVGFAPAFHTTLGVAF
jgi:hypothetical protein